MTDVVWCIPTRGITYSVSHHDGCYLVHPDMWYYLFGLPLCWMLFGASQHVVSLIRSPITTDAIWCTPTCGITYSVSHHAECCLVHPNMWYQLNVMRHQDGSRLVHPAMWDIGKFWGAFVTDADLCIPSGDSFDISTNSPLSRIPFNESRLYYHSHSFGFQISPFNPIITFVSSFQRYTQSMYLFIHSFTYTHSYIYSFTYSFHILIHIFIHVYSFTFSFTYTHSCILIHKYSFIITYSRIHFIYSFTYSFTYTHSCILIHKYSFTYSFHILIHIFIHVYSFMYTHS